MQYSHLPFIDESRGSRRTDLNMVSTGDRVADWDDEACTGGIERIWRICVLRKDTNPTSLAYASLDLRNA